MSITFKHLMNLWQFRLPIEKATISALYSRKREQVIEIVTSALGTIMISCGFAKLQNLFLYLKLLVTRSVHVSTSLFFFDSCHKLEEIVCEYI